MKFIPSPRMKTSYIYDAFYWCRSRMFVDQGRVYMEQARLKDKIASKIIS